MTLQDAKTISLAELTPWFPIGFLVAIALAIYFTPVLRDAARNFGIVDRPDGKLKDHNEPVAYLGGIAVFLAFVLALGLTFQETFNSTTLALMLGGSIILILGLIDDLGALSPAVKFFGQLLAAFVLLKSGVQIKLLILPPAVADLLTILWIVTVTNAFNIIDVMDGLCTGVGITSFLGFFAVALTNASNPDAVVASESASLALFIACFAGALLGFLRYNFKPAQIYLGDAGSMLIGFLAAAIPLTLRYTERDKIAMLSPLFLLGVPLFDLGLVIVLRLAKGKSPFRGSPDHFAVRLKRHGWPVPRIVLGAYALNAALVFVGIVLMRVEQSLATYLIGAVLAAMVVLGFLISRVGNQSGNETTPPRGA